MTQRASHRDVLNAETLSLGNYLVHHEARKPRCCKNSQHGYNLVHNCAVHLAHAVCQPSEWQASKYAFRITWKNRPAFPSIAGTTLPATEAREHCKCIRPTGTYLQKRSVLLARKAPKSPCDGTQETRGPDLSSKSSNTTKNRNTISNSQHQPHDALVVVHC